jgi:hypothetical protein
LNSNFFFGEKNLPPAAKQTSTHSAQYEAAALQQIKSISCLLLLLVLQQQQQLVVHHIIAADQNLLWNKKLKGYTIKNKVPTLTPQQHPLAYFRKKN